MKLLTEDAVILCDHKLGKVGNRPSQSLVTIGHRRVLAETDPVGWSISHCPYIGVALKPCTTTLAVQRGYSTFMRINGHRVCLDTITGLTDANPPPGTFHYTVSSPGQNFVTGTA